jgi:hypothetical protein
MSRLMSVLRKHLEMFREILNFPGLVADPFLMLGVQVVHRDDLPAEFDYPDLKQLLEARGLRQVATLDYFDPRADLRYDLNLPIPEQEHERYRTVLDIGTIEHVFDTRQALENCMRAVKTGGHYCLWTPVKGYFMHGMHTFDPRAINQALVINGFDVPYMRFRSREGEWLRHPRDAHDSMMLIVGKKTRPISDFRIPQQPRWAKEYAALENPEPASSPAHDQGET